MKHLSFRFAAAVLVLLVAGACGLARGGTGGEADSADPAVPGFGASPTLVRDPDHSYRVVNLHSFNGRPGGSVDIYPVVESNLGALGSSAAPIATDLGYGQVSEPLPPGGITGAFGAPTYGLAVRPHNPTEPGSANLSISITDTSHKPWQRGLVVLGGTGNGLQSQTFYDSTGPDEPNPVPASVPGKISLMIDGQHTSESSTFLLAGTAAGCVKGDHESGGATAVNQNAKLVQVTLDAGVSSIGFWRTNDFDFTASTCSGPPVFSVPLAGLTAGSRAIVFAYGPDDQHLAGLMVPIDG
ncbi:MAG TPA: hypothetical protein VF163_09360 [Micromonosporaceae bacterium]